VSWLVVIFTREISFLWVLPPAAGRDIAERLHLSSFDSNSVSWEPSDPELADLTVPQETDL
jgi:hypothetical protein